MPKSVNSDTLCLVVVHAELNRLVDPQPQDAWAGIEQIALQDAVKAVPVAHQVPLEQVTHRSPWWILSARVQLRWNYQNKLFSSSAGCSFPGKDHAGRSADHLLCYLPIRKTESRGEWRQAIEERLRMIQFRDKVRSSTLNVGLHRQSPDVACFPIGTLIHV